jgi:hypothetical protein
MVDPGRRLISRTKTLGWATARMQSSLRRISRVYDDLNAYLFAAAFGLAVLDGTVFAATRLPPLAAKILDTSSETSPSAAGVVSNASDPIAQEACGMPLSCAADW